MAITTETYFNISNTNLTVRIKSPYLSSFKGHNLHDKEIIGNAIIQNLDKIMSKESYNNYNIHKKPPIILMSFIGPVPAISYVGKSQTSININRQKVIVTTLTIHNSHKLLLRKKYNLIKEPYDMFIIRKISDNTYS